MFNPTLSKITRWNLTVGGVYGLFGTSYRVEVLRESLWKKNKVDVRRRDTGELMEVFAFDLI